MEEYFFPQPDNILDAIHERIIPFKRHQVKLINSLKVYKIEPERDNLF